MTDITYVATGEGWLYLAGIKDVFTCELAGYAMNERMTQTLTATSLWKAVRNKRPTSTFTPPASTARLPHRRYCPREARSHLRSP